MQTEGLDSRTLLIIFAITDIKQSQDREKGKNTTNVSPAFESFLSQCVNLLICVCVLLIFWILIELAHLHTFLAVLHIMSDLQPIYNRCVLLCEMHASESRTVVMGTRRMVKQQLIVLNVTGTKK